MRNFLLRLAASLGVGLAGVITGAWAGMGWYGLAVPLGDRDSLEGLGYGLVGGVMGFVAGAFIGCFLIAPPGIPLPRRLGMSVATVVAVVAAALGSAYFGSFTDVDGPGSLESYFGILLVPAGLIALIWIAKRSSSDRGRERKS